MIEVSGKTWSEDRGPKGRGSAEPRLPPLPSAPGDPAVPDALPLPFPLRGQGDQLVDLASV